MRYDPISAVAGPQATYSFPNGGYRIQTRPSPDPAHVGPGRAGSLRMDVNYTSFYVSVDIVDWNENVNQAFGIIARVRQPGLGTTDGYAFTYDFGGHDLDITRFIDEDTRTAAGGGAIGSGNDHADFVHGRVYRMVAIGQGADLTVRLYELPDTEHPIASVVGTDTSPYATVLTNGVCGLLVYDNSSQSAGGISPDITFDNYFATDVEPPRLTLTDLFFGSYKISWPAPSTGFKLQYSSVLPATTWTDVPEDAIFEDPGTRFTIIDTTMGNRFYRLFRP
jgi:hypothetical protein